MCDYSRSGGSCQGAICHLATDIARSICDSSISTPYISPGAKALASPHDVAPGPQLKSRRRTYASELGLRSIRPTTSSPSPASDTAWRRDKSSTSQKWFCLRSTSAHSYITAPNPPSEPTRAGHITLRAPRAARVSPVRQRAPDLEPECCPLREWSKACGRSPRLSCPP